MNDRQRFVAYLESLEPDDIIGHPYDRCPLAHFYGEPITDEFLASLGLIDPIDWQYRFVARALRMIDDQLPRGGSDTLTAAQCLAIMRSL